MKSNGDARRTEPVPSIELQGAYRVVHQGWPGQWVKCTLIMPLHPEDVYKLFAPAPPRPRTPQEKQAQP